MKKLGIIFLMVSLVLMICPTFTAATNGPGWPEQAIVWRAYEPPLTEFGCCRCKADSWQQCRGEAITDVSAKVHYIYTKLYLTIGWSNLKGQSDSFTTTRAASAYWDLDSRVTTAKTWSTTANSDGTLRWCYAKGYHKFQKTDGSTGWAWYSGPTGKDFAY